MTNNQLMTAGAVAFAGFAAWFALRKAGVPVGMQTGEQQRMAGVNDWMTQNATQQNATNTAIVQQWGSMAQAFKTQPDFYV